MSSTLNHRRNERGNALFLILIAVALFAALSYAVTQTGRGGGGTNKEQSVLAAGQITDYPAGVRTSVQRMILTNNATATTADFLLNATPAAINSGANVVFDQASTGGGAQLPPVMPSSATGGTAGIGNAAAGPTWRFKASPVPSTSKIGWFIEGVGTDTANTGRDAFAFIGLDSGGNTCAAINKQLGQATFFQGVAVDFTSTSTKEGDPVNQDGNGAADAGTMAAAGSATTINAGGLPFGCFANNATSATTAPYVYYHALIEQ